MGKLINFSKALLSVCLLLNATFLLAKDDKPRPKKTEAQLERMRDPDAQYGKTVIIKKKKSQLRVNGPVQINLSEITGITQLQGPAEINSSIFNILEHSGTLNCFDAQINTAKLTGVVNLNRTKIFKNLEVFGTLTANNSIIEHMLVNSAKIVLENCIIHDLTIIGDVNYPHHQPIIELRGATTISGTIKFLETDGNIQVFGNNVSLNNFENGTIDYL
jgi:NDP-sugar pyrophosphorylase family protein